MHHLATSIVYWHRSEPTTTDHTSIVLLRGNTLDATHYFMKAPQCDRILINRCHISDTCMDMYYILRLVTILITCVKHGAPVREQYRIVIIDYG